MVLIGKYVAGHQRRGRKIGGTLEFVGKGTGRGRRKNCHAGKGVKSGQSI